MDYLFEEEMADRLAEAARQVTVGAQYRHYKQKTYVVLGLAILEVTAEVSVIYQAQYGKRLTFIRPLADWTQEVKWKGETVKRFVRL